ncbi:MAG: MATE family efflux transporter [Erysipelotrichaceae bacterium]|nr:MATE family efflux transporter [Erysipelotrichaceae bacterium]
MEDNKKEIVNTIGKDFTTFGLFKFALPAFFTNVFSQLFKSLDDALFISRYVGPKALAGLNLLSPVFSIQIAFSNLCSLGAATISAQFMGENKQKQAKQIFSKIIIGTIVVGAIFSLLMNLFDRPILSFLGADEELYSYAIYQVRLVYSIMPIILINAVFSMYYSTAGKPKMGTICSVVNGTINILLDVVLITYLKLGTLGAAIATAAGEIAVFFIGLFFFLNKKNEIHFVKPEGEIIKPCLSCFKYAMPQCVNSLSFGVTNLIINKQLLSLIGSDGIAANAIISDVRNILTTGLIGIAASISPVISYRFGERNVPKLKQALSSTLKIWLFTSFSLVIIGLFVRTPLIKVFMSKDSTEAFYNMSIYGLTIEIFSIPFVSACFTVSRLFVSVGNAKVATFVSLLRNLVFRSISLLVLPAFFGVNGVWFAIPFGEFISFIMIAIVVYINRDNYGYGKSGIAHYITNY